MAVLTEAQRWRKDASDASAVLTEATQAPEFSAPVRAELVAALTRLELDRPLPAHEDMEDRSADAGMLWLDALAADHLAGLGGPGSEFAEKLRQAATSRWMGRFAPATDLWLQWRRPAGGAWPPFVRLLVRAVESGGATVQRTPAATVRTKPCAGAVTPSRVPMIALPVARVLLDALGPGGPEGISQNIDAHRFIRWFIQPVQAVPGREAITVESWAALAADIGGSDRTRKHLPAIITTLAEVVVEIPNGPLRFIYECRETSRGQISLRAGNAFTLAASTATGRAVPVLPMPPAIGRRNDHAPDATLQFALMTLLAERAAAPADTGRLLLGPEELRWLAGRAGMSVSRARRTLTAWSDGLAGENLLTRSGADLVAIANPEVMATGL